MLLGISVYMVYIEDSTCYPRYSDVPLKGEMSIPKIIMQTHYDLSIVPEKVGAQFERLAQGFKRVLYDDTAAKSFIQKNFSEDLGQVFESFSTGAFKADFFRYCYLYVEGGIYLDIKTELVIPIQRIYDALKRDGTTMATCLTTPKWLSPHSLLGPCVYQGVIFARPRHPIFLECIAYMTSYGWRGKWDYFAFCRNFTKRLQERGLWETGAYPESGWTLWSENVTRSTLPCGGVRQKKLGLCSFITDATTEEMLFITRFSDFPWTS